MGYQFTFQGQVFEPAGRVETAVDSTAEHNRKVEAEEIDWLKTGPDNVFLYVRMGTAQIGTWLGTSVATHVQIGPSRSFPCFGPFPSKRRAVSCRIFGVLYHGWYFESSGDYCRLKKAKRQPKV